MRTGGNRQVVHGIVESVAMKYRGKPGSGESHARFDERGLETGHGLGTAAPATCAWTAPDLSATAPALDSDPQTNLDIERLRPVSLSVQRPPLEAIVGPDTDPAFQQNQ